MFFFLFTHICTLIFTLNIDGMHSADYPMFPCDELFKHVELSTSLACDTLKGIFTDT